MKLYKFKDFTNESNHPHFLQIVLEKKIWCASPDSLNDEDEFKFELDCTPTSNTANLLAQQIRQNRPMKLRNSFPPEYVANETLNNNNLECIAKHIFVALIKQDRSELGITSFASVVNSTLWEKYGGNGNGAYVEINIPDSFIGQAYHHVDYVEKKIIHVDALLAGTLSSSGALKAYKMLLTKTEKWSYEKEIRFIGDGQNFNFIFDGHISKVIFGAKVPNNVQEKLLYQISNHCNSNNIIISTSET